MKYGKDDSFSEICKKANALSKYTGLLSKLSNLLRYAFALERFVGLSLFIECRPKKTLFSLLSYFFYL